jgi:hypothetical protein
MSDYHEIRERLKIIAKPDLNADLQGGYRVRSLYFDNIYDKVLREKLYGISQREKFRIRYYNDNTSLIKLEKKSKMNGLCSKRVTRITKEECEKLLAGDTGSLLNSQDPLKQELYAKMKYQLLRPRTIVDYHREPYIYPYGNVRITFDTDIRSGLYSTDFFKTDLSGIPVSNAAILMEVKYDEFLPDVIEDAIRVNQRRASAYSKYAGCRMFG